MAVFETMDGSGEEEREGRGRKRFEGQKREQGSVVLGRKERGRSV